MASRYQRSLQNAAEVITHANEPATNRAREKLGKELAAWLSTLPQGYATDLARVGPEDLLVFMDCQWLPNHAGTNLPGSDIAVASPQVTSLSCLQVS